MPSPPSTEHASLFFPSSSLSLRPARASCAAAARRGAEPPPQRQGKTAGGCCVCACGRGVHFQSARTRGTLWHACLGCGSLPSCRVPVVMCVDGSVNRVCVTRQRGREGEPWRVRAQLALPHAHHRGLTRAPREAVQLTRACQMTTQKRVSHLSYCFTPHVLPLFFSRCTYVAIRSLLLHTHTDR